MPSYLSHLECSYCFQVFSHNEPHNTCRSCGKVLLARYDLAAATKTFRRESLTGRIASMWRYAEVMPVLEDSNIVTLGEGFTPLSKAERLGKLLGSDSLYVKDESANPTASFKARGMSVAVSKAKELGVKGLSVPSAGNAGGALAAYAARAGMKAKIFMPRDTPEANIKEVGLSGMEATLVDGLINKAGRLSRQTASSESLFDLSTLREPYRLEGKKTMGYEIAEQMGWTLPDAIIYPTGGGTGIVGFWKAFEEMGKLGWIEGTLPRIFSVQAEGCAPIVRAFLEKTEFAEPWRNAHTVAAGLRVPETIADYMVLSILRETDGGAVAVSDQEMMDWIRNIAMLEGMFVCPEGAATAAAASKLVADGTLSPKDTIVLINTGSGLKYLELL